MSSSESPPSTASTTAPGVEVRPVNGPMLAPTDASRTAISAEVQDDLIFDLGGHRGFDTAYYLKKGFRVVTIEANPKLCDLLQSTFAQESKDGKINIVNQCLWNSDGETIKFYVNLEKDDWSSALPHWANKGQHKVEEIAAETVTIGTLFNTFGVPRYIKCDIEGADEIFAHGLMRDGRMPDFVSIEGGSIDAIMFMRATGYDRVQIVNQMLHNILPPANPPREGQFVDQKFDGFMTGPFGLELDPKRWTTIADALDRYFMFRRLRGIDDNLARGWLDFHFSTAKKISQT